MKMLAVFQPNSIMPEVMRVVECSSFKDAVPTANELTKFYEKGIECFFRNKHTGEYLTMFRLERQGNRAIFIPIGDDATDKKLARMLNS